MSAPWKFAGLYGPNTLLDQNSKEATNLSINVFLTGTTTFANLYTDQTKATGRSNPILSDAFGNFSFFADPGLYDLSYTLQGVPNKFTVSVPPYPGTSPYPDISAASQLAGGVSINGGGWLGFPTMTPMYDPGSNLGTTGATYVAPITGLYLVQVQLALGQDSTAGAMVATGFGYQPAGGSMTQKGRGATAARGLSGAGSINPTALCVDQIQMNAGDLIQAWYTYSGTATTTDGSSPVPNWFKVTYLGPI